LTAILNFSTILNFFDLQQAIFWVVIQVLLLLYIMKSTLNAFSNKLNPFSYSIFNIGVNYFNYLFFFATLKMLNMFWSSTNLDRLYILKNTLTRLAYMWNQIEQKPPKRVFEKYSLVKNFIKTYRDKTRTLQKICSK
jgi:hypothetical protein